MTRLEVKILKKLKNAKHGLKERDLLKSLGISTREQGEFKDALEELASSSRLLFKNGRIYSADGLGLKKAEIVKVTNTFGFARIPDEPISGMASRDVFIPGRMLKGAMPGDTVLIKRRPGSGSLPEGTVEYITEAVDKPFAGLIKNEPDGLFVMPDSYVKYPVRLSPKSSEGLKEGEKVLARIISRGERHSEHMAGVVESFGRADTAKVCCGAILAQYGVKSEFPPEASAQARSIEAAGIHPKEISSREDFRGKPIFTIDGADTKDVDDAISLERTASGWELGVHIADVSHYVPFKSPLDIEAYERGTSVYYADYVVPMLPKELSNGICSLNPGEDRLALSAIIALDSAARINSCRFVKSVIRSRVKGVYSEINSILDNSAPAGVSGKYAGLTEVIREMADLAGKLAKKRYARGGMELDSHESKITVSPDGSAIGVSAREHGASENIIEEFMLAANEASASFSIMHGLPFVFRVHEPPAPDKIECLYTMLDTLGVRHGKGGAADPSALARILDGVKGTRLSPIVNNMLLRSMSKAKYSHVNTGHFGLALENYAHFTSPIRRYPDLTVHRILSGFVTGMRAENIMKRFASYVPGASVRSTAREIAAMGAERGCEDCYKAEYMKSFIGESFPGFVSSVTPFGAYVRLENTVEGLVRLSDFPAGDWIYDGAVSFSSSRPKGIVRIGDGVMVKISGANVSAGQVDMTFS